MTTITASTSVVLVDTTSGLSPYIVYFPYISTVGRIITVRDNSGYASTNNSILLSTQSGVYFQDKQSTLTINQPYGYITFSVQPNGIYSILNTFAFPNVSSSVYVYNVNTTKLGIEDPQTNILNYITVSTGSLFYNNNVVGDVSQSNLQSNITNIQAFINSKLNSINVVRRYVAVGNNALPNNPEGTIQFSDNGVSWANSTVGFSNGGIDVNIDRITGLWVACGNNYSPTTPSNYGFLQWSSEGLVWNNSSKLLSLSTLRLRVHNANGLWHSVGAGTDSNMILWSSNGKDWNPSINSTNIFLGTQFNSITYGRNIWVACGQGNPVHPANTFIYSSNGSNWYPNPTININISTFYDVIYTGSNFVSLVSNTQGASNILVSVSGSNDSTLLPINFNNEPGFLASDGNILVGVSASYHKYSINYGYTWINMPDFPLGTPGRPYYDGALWWVPMSNGTTANMYYSSTGSNLWTSTNITGLFTSGNPVGVVTLNTSSNLGLQLLSTVSALELSFHTSTLTANILNIGSFSIYNSSSGLYISSFNNTDTVYTNNISTNSIITNSIQTNNLQLIDVSISTINISTLLVSDVIYTSSLITSSIITDYANISTLNFSTFVTSTIEIQKIITDKINVNTISSSMGYIDTLSSTTLNVSTIHLIDGLTNTLTDLNANNNNLFFQGQKLLTSAGQNPLFFTYQLGDTTGAAPGTNGFFTVNTADLNTITTINFSVNDLDTKYLGYFFSYVGVFSILHVIKANSIIDSVYLINSIALNGDYYTFTLQQLIGTSIPLNINDICNFYIANIGIKPPPSSPTDTVVVKAQRGTNGFNFSSAATSVPTSIGTYSGGTNGFIINLNTNSYSLTNIPATVGSIVYYDNTVNKYKSYNVKYGSINDNTGGFVTMGNSVTSLSVGGLTVANFPGAANDTSPSAYAIYITIKFLN